MATRDLRGVVRTRLLDWAFKPGQGVDRRGCPLAWSLDCRELTLHGPTLAAIAELLWPMVAAHAPALIAGPSLSADPIVAALLLAASRRGVELSGGLLRREQKRYGLLKLVEGPPVAPGVTAVVVDDVLTHGSSTTRVMRMLRELGAIPVAVVTVVDLENDDRKRLDGIAYHTVFTASDLGLARFKEPAPSPCRGWTVRGVESPIPPARPVRPVFVAGETILASARRGVVTIDRGGGLREVQGSGIACQAACEDRLVLGTATAVRAVDVPTLRQLWTMNVPARALCCSADGDVLVARADAPEILRMDGRTGAVTATRVLAACVDSLHLAADCVVAITDSAVVALDRSLDARWVLAEPAWSPVSWNDGLFALTRGPALTRLDPRDGSVVWSRPIGERALPALVAADDLVAFAVESVVVGLSGAGSVRWVHSAPRRIVAGPVACPPGALAIADGSGIVRVLRTADGGHLASYSALPVRPIALAGSPRTLVAIGADGDAWGIEHTPQA